MSNVSPFRMVRDANVDIAVIERETLNGIYYNEVQAEISDGNGFTFETTFGKNSKVAKSSDFMDEQDLADKLSGGNYFIMNDELHSYKDSSYTGFVHKDETLDKLMNVLGTMPARKVHQFISDGKSTKNSGKQVLGRIWNTNLHEIKGFDEGGKLKSSLLFKWDAFSADIKPTFEILRLICTNGMMTRTELLNKKVKVASKWKKSLEIAAKQSNNLVHKLLDERLNVMRTNRASVKEVSDVLGHAEKRKENPDLPESQYQKCANMIKVIAESGVVSSKSSNDQLYEPSSFTELDVWNMVTELNSHVSSTSNMVGIASNQNSTSFALEKFANDMLFTKGFDKQGKLLKGNRLIKAIKEPSLSKYSDPDTVLYSELKAA